MQNDNKNRRRNYFIDRKFQSQFIMKFCLIIIIASLMIGGLTYYFNRQTTTVAFENLKVVVKSTADFILPTVLYILGIVTVLVGIATIAVTLFTSHKIAGPIYRLKIELEKMKNKDLSSAVYLRADDQLKKVAFELDEMRIGFKNSFNILKENWNTIKTNLQRSKKEMKDEKEEKRMENSIKSIDSELAGFKTD